jgi:hypothetical protein
LIDAIASDQNGDYKNTPIFPSWKIGSVSGVGSPFPPGKGTMPASGLQTVFSITHPDH